MAPEQVRGEPVDRRVDVFASGIVLFELLTGQRLFGASSPRRQLSKILHNKIPRVRDVCPSHAPYLDTVVCQALAEADGNRIFVACSVRLRTGRVRWRCRVGEQATRIALTSR